MHRNDLVESIAPEGDDAPASVEGCEAGCHEPCVLGVHLAQEREVLRSGNNMELLILQVNKGLCLFQGGRVCMACEGEQ